MANDITKKETQDDGKRQALTIMKGALELAGLNPDDYDFSIYKKGKPKAAPNIQLFQTAAYLAATCLSPSANKILMYFLSISEFENYVGIDQKTLHEELNISLSSTEKGLKELRENGIVIKTQHPADKRRNDYFINPMQAWKGKSLNRKITLSKIEKENPDQLHIFGESLQENIKREQQEIKEKRPNLFLTRGKQMNPSDS